MDNWKGFVWVNKGSKTRCYFKPSKGKVFDMTTSKFYKNHFSKIIPAEECLNMLYRFSYPVELIFTEEKIKEDRWINQ